MITKDKSAKALILAIISLGLILQFQTLPYTMSLNKSIGWGWGLREYYEILITFLFVISIILTLDAIKTDKLNILNILAILIHIVLGIKFYTFYNMYF